MASFFTNKGAAHVASILRGGVAPTHYYLALVTAADVPSVDTNVLGDLTEIAAGNGYTAGGAPVHPNGTDFPALTENDTLNQAELDMIDVAWTASGGPIPDTGDPARWAVLVNDDATVADREVYAVFDLNGTRSVVDTFALTVSFPANVMRFIPQV